jgi:hypothetical protein
MLVPFPIYFRLLNETPIKYDRIWGIFYLIVKPVCGVPGTTFQIRK